MKKWIAVLLALTMLLALAACGGNNGGNSGNGGENQNTSQNGGNAQEPETPGDPETPEDGGAGQEPTVPEDGGDTQNPDTPTTDGGEEQQEPEQPAQGGITLSRTDFTLFSAGSAYRLTVTGAEGECAFASSDESVATVAADGTVTAVAPGQATITVTCGEETATCIVRCRWETAGEGETEDPGTEEPTAPEEPAGSGVDLSAFYTEITGQYSFGSLMEFTGDVLESYYPGLGAISTEQCLVMGSMMTFNNGEFCLVEVSDSGDVDAVKSIFQTRIDGMVNGGAWYPEPTEQWTNNSRVVSNGNFVMMVVHENCDDIVDAFNALFE